MATLKKNGQQQPNTPARTEGVIHLSSKHVGIFLWRLVVFTIGLIPVSGTIEVTNSPWTFTVSSSRFFGYLFIANSVITGLIDLSSRSERTRERSRRAFHWITLMIIVVLLLLVLLPTIW